MWGSDGGHVQQGSPLVQCMLHRMCSKCIWRSHRTRVESLYKGIFLLLKEPKSLAQTENISELGNSNVWPKGKKYFSYRDHESVEGSAIINPPNINNTVKGDFSYMTI